MLMDRFHRNCRAGRLQQASGKANYILANANVNARFANPSQQVDQGCLVSLLRGPESVESL